MAHSAPPNAPRRKLEIIAGVVIVLVAIIVGVFAIVALHQPNGHQAGVARTSALPSGSTGPAPISSPTTRSSVVTTPTISSPPPTTQPVSSTPVTKSPVTTAVSKPPAGNRLPVIVLNNTSASAETGTAVSRFQAGGWTASNGGFFDGDILSTAAYYDPNADGSKAAALALQAQFPAIKRVVPRFSGLPDGPIVVILTSDYS